MSEDRPTAPGGEPTTSHAGWPPSPALAARRPGYWFPLLMFGLLIALSVLVSQLAQPPPAATAGFALLVRVTNWSATQVTYLGSGPDALGGFPMGWYWTAALVATFALTAIWYRWRDRHAGSRTPVRAFLVTGLALTALAAALPLLIPAAPALAGWLGGLWTAGTYALVIIAVGLCLLARAERSRALLIVALVYSVPVALVVLASAQFAALGYLPPAGPPEAAYSSTFFILLPPTQSPFVLLPTAVLLMAGLAALAVSVIGRRRRPGAQP